MTKLIIQCLEFFCFIFLFVLVLLGYIFWGNFFSTCSSGTTWVNDKFMLLSIAITTNESTLENASLCPFSHLVTSDGYVFRGGFLNQDSNRSRQESQSLPLIIMAPEPTKIPNQQMPTETDTDLEWTLFWPSSFSSQVLND